MKDNIFGEYKKPDAKQNAAMYDFIGGIYSIYSIHDIDTDHKMGYGYFGHIYTGKNVRRIVDEQYDLKFIATSIRNNQIKILDEEKVGLPHRYPFSFKEEIPFDVTFVREHKPVRAKKLGSNDFHDFAKHMKNIQTVGRVV